MRPRPEGFHRIDKRDIVALPFRWIEINCFHRLQSGIPVNRSQYWTPLTMMVSSVISVTPFGSDPQIQC